MPSILGDILERLRHRFQMLENFARDGELHRVLPRYFLKRLFEPRRVNVIGAPSSRTICSVSTWIRTPFG